MARRRSLVRVKELATRYTLKPQTVYKWIQRGILNEEHGLMRIGGLCLISIELFEKNPVVFGVRHDRTKQHDKRTRVIPSDEAAQPFESMVVQPDFLPVEDWKQRATA